MVAWRAAHPDGHLVGDTSWAFANPALRAEPFDVLIIDEAGQFALADTLAVAGAARNLVLLGDPQQLPQVVTGIHPDGADASALSHLLGSDDVIPAEFGYFLDLTRRMHPDVCEPVSALAYRGRLHAHPLTAARSVDGIAAGLYLHDVPHHANTTRSDPEVAAVRGLVETVLRRRLVDLDGERILGGPDVLVVAPYNRQVRAIEHALRNGRDPRRPGRDGRPVPGPGGARGHRVADHVQRVRGSPRAGLSTLPQPPERRVVAGAGTGGAGDVTRAARQHRAHGRRAAPVGGPRAAAGHGPYRFPLAAPRSPPVVTCFR